MSSMSNRVYIRSQIMLYPQDTRRHFFTPSSQTRCIHWSVIFVVVAVVFVEVRVVVVGSSSGSSFHFRQSATMIQEQKTLCKSKNAQGK